MNPLGTGTLRGLVAGVLTAQIILTIFTFFAALANGWNTNSSSYFVFVIIGYIIAVAFATILGSLLGLLVGICMLPFERGTKGWLAALIGAAVPFMCSLLFGIPQYIWREMGSGFWNNTWFILIYIAFAIVGWQVNRERIKSAPPLHFQLLDTKLIVEYILQGQRGWNSSRYDIDRELLEKGYDPAEIEKAWAIIAEGLVWLDDKGNVRLGKPPSQKVFLPFLPRLTGGYAILYFMGLHFLSLFFTPLVYLPGIILTLIILVAYKRIPAVANTVAKIRI